MTTALRLLIIVAFVFGGYFVRYSVRRNNRAIIIVAVSYGAAAAIAALILNSSAQHFYHFVDGLNPNAHPTIHQLAISTAVYVAIEESVKFIPLAIYLLRKKSFNMISDGVLYFGLAGLTFGAIEHLIYGVSYGEVTLVVRIVLVLFLHAGLTGMVGYFYARDRVLGNRFRTILAFIAAFGLHYIYDLALFSANRPGSIGRHIALVILAGVIAAGLNCLLIWLFYLASRDDWHRLQTISPPATAATPTS